MPSSRNPNPALLEVLAYLPTGFSHCNLCEQVFDAAQVSSIRKEMLNSYPAEWLEEAAQLSDWLNELAASFGDQLQIKIYDPQSIQGFMKSLRHWVRRYPTFIINNEVKYTGWDREHLKGLLVEKALLQPGDDR